MATTADGLGGRSPMAELPNAAGEIIAVTQTVEHGVVTQRIALQGDSGVSGENTITVKVNDDPGPWDLDGPVGIPTKYMIATELEANFPGVNMGISQAFTRNSFGPFGYALGHPSAGVTCVYAWEFGVWKWSKLGEAPTGGPSMPLRPTSVRVRLCRSTIGESQMVSMLRGLQVFPANSRIAYVDPNYSGGVSDGDALSAAGYGGSEGSSAKPAPISGGRAARRKVAHHVHHRRRYAEAAEGRAAADERPLPGAVAVPMPGGSVGPAAAAAAASANPLLAPLSATTASRPAAVVDDLPLPSRAPSAKAAAPATAAPRSATVPLPD